MGYTEEIAREFSKLQTRQDVAKLLGIKDRSLRYFLYVLRPDYLYREFSIPKRKGGSRKICTPDKRLKAIQRKLLRVLEQVYRPKPSAYGFVSGRSNVMNAENHDRHTFVFNIDLKDFFDQIHFGRVKGMFQSKPYELGEEAAMVLAQIACYQGKLPQGAPTSPIVTNMVCAPLDTQLIKLAKRHKLVYTRYADDITFSTHLKKMPEEVACMENGKWSVGSELGRILEENSFTVNEDKIYLRDKSKRQEVTGLVVNQFVNVKREYLREVRCIFHCCQTRGLYEAAKIYIGKGLCDNIYILNLVEDEKREEKTKEKEVVEWFEKVLKGKVEYIGNVRGRRNGYFIKYAVWLNRLCQREVLAVSETTDFENQVEQRCFIFESNDAQHPCQGSGFLLKGYGILTNAHVTKDGAFYTVKTWGGEKKAAVSTQLNQLAVDDKIDYALYKGVEEEGWEPGDSDTLKIGAKVKLIGFPQYNEGDTPYMEDCEITGKRMYMQEQIYCVSGRIVHGASGGVVLDKNEKVVGIILCGANKFDEEDSIMPGFIPINRVLADIQLKAGHTL